MLYDAGKRSDGQTAFVVEASQHETHASKNVMLSCVGCPKLICSFVPDKP